MSPASSLYNLLAPKPKPPPYNKVAKLTMTVEVETVILRNTPGGPALKPERKYPYYPVLERTTEVVGGDGVAAAEEAAAAANNPSTSPPRSTPSSSSPSSSRASSRTPTAKRSSAGSSPARSSSSSSPGGGTLASSAPSTPPPTPPRTRHPRPSAPSPSRRSPSPGSDTGSGTEAAARVVGIVKRNGQVERLDGSSSSRRSSCCEKEGGLDLDEVARLLGSRDVEAVICSGTTEYRGWTPKKDKFTRRERSGPDYRALRLAEAEEARKKKQGGWIGEGWFGL